MTHCIVGVRFKTAGKIFYFDPHELPVEKDDFVIVDTIRGLEYGKVVVGKKIVNENDVVLPLKSVVRLANDQDKMIVEQNKSAARIAFSNYFERFREQKMKLLDVEYTFDRSKMYFHFTADGRIDFRELVKELVSVYRIRIELRQVGIRDEAKIKGGIGPCGRILCCSTFLGDFDPISIKMAKDQNLSLNPTKISGLCGRLMCCLKYEYDNYENSKGAFPEYGSSIVTSYGKGTVVSINVNKNLVKVKIGSQNTIVEVDIDDPSISW